MRNPEISYKKILDLENLPKKRSYTRKSSPEEYAKFIEGQRETARKTWAERQAKEPTPRSNLLQTITNKMCSYDWNTEDLQDVYQVLRTINRLNDKE